VTVRIAFYTPRASFLDHALAHGGDPIFLDALFEALQKRGHELRVVSRLHVRDLWSGQIPARRFMREALSVRRQVKQFSPTGWIVYNPSQTYPDLFGWWQRPKRYVLLAAHPWNSARVPRKWRPLLSWMHRRSVRRADVITTWRAKSIEGLLREGADRRRVRVLLPAFPRWSPLPTRLDARERLGLDPNIPIVLCATRFSIHAKHGKTWMLLDLLAVFASLSSDVHLLLTGDGPGRQHIEDAIEERRLTERVHLLGEVPRTDLKWIFAACDVYAYPHTLDWPWSSVFEAQACGRPVVAMRTDSNERTISDGQTGLLADTLEEFRDHLATLTGDRARASAMGESASRFYRDRHSIESRAREIEELLDG